MKNERFKYEYRDVCTQYPDGTTTDYSLTA